MRSIPRRFAGLLLAVAASLAAAGPARGQAGIQVSVDRAEVTIDDRVMLSVVVTGSQSAEPVLPDLSDFRVIPRGQETRLSLVNGRASSSVAYAFLLEPLRVGTFAIGAASVEIDGRTYASRPFEIRVLEAAARPSPSREIFVTVKVSTDKPYVGQQVIYTWRLYRRVRIADARLEPQAFDGFLVEDLGEVREYESTVRGQTYLVSEFRKALFPQEEGRLEVPGSRLTCKLVVRADADRRSLFDDFFGRARTENRVLRTQPIELEVRPLPVPPPGFSGLVGSFSLTTRVSRTELQVGQSTTVEMTVGGTGNVQMLAEPRLPPMPSFKVYDDKPSTSIERAASGLSGSRTFRKALVPLEPGELAVPGLSLTYFDPEAERFEVSRAPSIGLRVAASDGPEELRLTEALAPAAGKVNVRILADDVLPLHRDGDDLTAPGGRLLPATALAAGLLGPPLLFLAVLVADRRRRRYADDASLRRRREAMRRARRSLREATVAAGRGEVGAAAHAASRCLRRYVGDKLGLEGAALTTSEVARLLEERGVENSLVQRTRLLLEQLESAQYGAARTRLEPAELERLLRQLNRSLRP